MDIFEAKDDISQGVAQALEVSLAQHEHPYARFGTDAYLAFLQGQALITTRKVADAERAIERFSHAIELSPEFAAAYVALAHAHIHLAHLTSEADTAPGMVDAYREARPLLERALQLDASLGQAYVLRADMKDYAGDAAGAEADYRKGLALAPNYGRGYESFASFLERHNRIDEAFAAIDRARLVDPLPLRNHYLKGVMLQASASIARRRVLYVEDTSTNARLMDAFFESMAGWELCVVDSAETGLQMPRSGAFDYLILDVMLPGMDGLTAISKFRALPHLKSIPGIGLSARASSEDRELAFRAGFDHYLTKPFEFTQLAKILGHSLEPHAVLDPSS